MQPWSRRWTRKEQNNLIKWPTMVRVFHQDMTSFHNNICLQVDQRTDAMLTNSSLLTLQPANALLEKYENSGKTVTHNSKGQLGRQNLFSLKSLRIGVHMLRCVLYLFFHYEDLINWWTICTLAWHQPRDVERKSSLKSSQEEESESLS